MNFKSPGTHQPRFGGKWRESLKIYREKISDGQNRMRRLEQFRTPVRQNRRYLIMTSFQNEAVEACSYLE